MSSSARRAACTTRGAGNLHKLYVQVYKTPSLWSTVDLSTQFRGAPAGAHFADTLPFWSKVEKLTIHERAHINPTAAVASTNPVTIVDVALHENLVRKMATERDLLIKLVLRKFVGDVTGSPARDLAVVVQMGATANAYDEILKVRAPSGFPIP